MNDTNNTNNQNMIDKALKIGIGIALFFYGKKILANKAQESADSQIDTNPAAGQARELDAAMNPSGNEWMRTFDTTDTNAIYAIAPQITDYDAVQKFYKAQTDKRVLDRDLIKELGANGYDKFLFLVTKGKTGSPKYSVNRTDIPANRWIVTKTSTNVRKTPKKESVYMLGHNIAKQVDAGNSVGITTGKYAFDEPNDVTFIEFWTLGAKDNVKHYFYIALSQVELLTKAQKDEREKTGKLPYTFIAGLSGTPQEPHKCIVSVRNTVVHDEQFKAVTTVPTNVIIGFPILTLDTGKGKYIKVQTVQGLIRWVKGQDVKEQNRS